MVSFLRRSQFFSWKLCTVSSGSTASSITREAVPEGRIGILFQSRPLQCILLACLQSHPNGHLETGSGAGLVPMAPIQTSPATIHSNSVMSHSTVLIFPSESKNKGYIHTYRNIRNQCRCYTEFDIHVVSFFPFVEHH